MIIIDVVAVRIGMSINIINYKPTDEFRVHGVELKNRLESVNKYIFVVLLNLLKSLLMLLHVLNQLVVNLPYFFG